MKKFNSCLTGLLILIFTLSCTSVNNNHVSHYISSTGELSSVIKIPDYKDSIKIMQLTDTHLSIADEQEADMMQYGERMHKAYMDPHKHYVRDTSETTFQYFDDILQKAKKENINLLLLTGDIVNFPSAATVKYVFDKLTATGIKWLYISGNHDWYYEGLPGSPDSLRMAWIEKSLTPLYNGHNPLYYSEIINGINFVCIDNSTYKVNDEQVQFLKGQLSGNEPIIMISHIPYSLSNNNSQPGTIALADLILANSDKIIAIFTGHTHRNSFYFTGNLCQYTTMAGFQGASIIADVKAE